jgi:hypothetical protein
MMLSMIPFVAAIVIPACGFYVYALGHFLREALQMRRERLSVTRFVDESENEPEPAPARNRATVLAFLPNHSHPSQHGAA